MASRGGGGGGYSSYGGRGRYGGGGNNYGGFKRNADRNNAGGNHKRFESCKNLYFELFIIFTLHILLNSFFLD